MTTTAPTGIRGGSAADSRPPSPAGPPVPAWARSTLYDPSFTHRFRKASVGEAS